MLRRVLAAAVALSLAGCASGPAGRGPAPAPVAAMPAAAAAVVPSVAAWDRVPGARAWTASLHRSLGEVGGALLAARPADRAEFCPGFDGQTPEERRAFYVALISGMAEYESTFDPRVTFQGRHETGRGLMQIGIRSASAYPGCAPESEGALHDPGVNLHCSVAILNRLVARDGWIGGFVGGKWRGAAAYWSVLRGTAASRERIARFTRGLPVCR